MRCNKLGLMIVSDNQMELAFLYSIFIHVLFFSSGRIKNKSVFVGEVS